MDEATIAILKAVHDTDPHVDDFVAANGQAVLDDLLAKNYVKVMDDSRVVITKFAHNQVYPR